MIIFLYGEDSYRLLERLQFLQNAFRVKFDDKGLSMSEIDGVYFDINEFRKHTKTSGLFAQKRFVTFRNLWAINKDDQEMLYEELGTPQQPGIHKDTILCVVTSNPPRKDNKLFKRMLKADTVEEYTELNPQQLRTFIEKKTKEHGAKIDRKAVEYLSTSIGNDLWRQAGEIKKLAHFTHTITEDIVRVFVDEALDENIFHLTDALGAKNVQQATKLLHEQFELGANTQYLITMLARQVSTILKVKKTQGKGMKLHPYVIKKALEQSKRFNEETLLELYWALLEIDCKIKTKTVSDRALLDLFIVQACAA